MKILRLALFFILVGCSSVAYREPSAAQLSCSDIIKDFFHDKKISRLESFKKRYLEITPLEYQKHLQDEALGREFKEIVQSISTGDELLETLKTLESFAGITRQYEFNSRVITDDYTSVIRPLIAESGLVSKTLELKPMIEMKQRGQILKAVSDIEKKIQKKSRWVSADSIRGIQYHFKMVFDPSLIDDYMTFIIEEISAGDSPSILARSYYRLVTEGYNLGMDIFGTDTLNIFASLPPSVRASTVKRLELEYIKAKKEAINSDKGKRRNIEFLLRAMFDKEYKEFFKKVGRNKRINEEDLIEKVDELWLKSRVKYQNPEIYSFRKVLESAKKLQESSLRKFLEGDESYVIYGSLPNGKANFVSSDLDIHPSKAALRRYMDTFERWHIESIDPNLEEYINKIKLDAIKKRGVSTTIELEETEKELASLWNRKKYNKGEILSIVANDSDFFDLDKLGVYNSILVEVRLNDIIVHLVDMIGNKKMIALRLE